MSYAYQWFGALVAGSFLYGCMLGMLLPPMPRHARVEPAPVRIPPAAADAGTGPTVLLRYTPSGPQPSPETDARPAAAGLPLAA